MSKAFDKISAGLNEALAIARGQAEPARLYVPPGRVQIPAYSDMWMRGDRYGEVVKITRRNNVEIAYVKLDKSGKTVRVVYADCTSA